MVPGPVIQSVNHSAPRRARRFRSAHGSCARAALPLPDRVPVRRRRGRRRRTRALLGAAVGAQPEIPGCLAVHGGEAFDVPPGVRQCPHRRRRRRSTAPARATRPRRRGPVEMLDESRCPRGISLLSHHVAMASTWLRSSALPCFKAARARARWPLTASRPPPGPAVRWRSSPARHAPARGRVLGHRGGERDRGAVPGRRGRRTPRRGGIGSRCLRDRRGAAGARAGGRGCRRRARGDRAAAWRLRIRGSPWSPIPRPAGSTRHRRCRHRGAGRVDEAAVGVEPNADAARVRRCDTGGQQVRPQRGALQGAAVPHGAGGDDHRIARAGAPSGRWWSRPVRRRRRAARHRRPHPPRRSAARSRSPHRRRRPSSAACGDAESPTAAGLRRNRRWSSSRATATAARSAGRIASITCRQSSPAARARARSASSAPRKLLQRGSRCRARRDSATPWRAGVAEAMRECTVARQQGDRRATRHQVQRHVDPGQARADHQDVLEPPCAEAASVPGAHGSSTTRPSVPAAGTGANARSRDSGMPPQGVLRRAPRRRPTATGRRRASPASTHRAPGRRPRRSRPGRRRRRVGPAGSGRRRAGANPRAP